MIAGKLAPIKSPCEFKNYVKNVGEIVYHHWARRNWRQKNCLSKVTGYNVELCCVSRGESEMNAI